MKEINRFIYVGIDYEETSKSVDESIGSMTLTLNEATLVQENNIIFLETPYGTFVKSDKFVLKQMDDKTFCRLNGVVYESAHRLISADFSKKLSEQYDIYIKDDIAFLYKLQDASPEDILTKVVLSEIKEYLDEV